MPFLIERRDVNLKLMPEAHAKFTQWCIQHGCSKQWKLAVMVDELVKGMELPKTMTAPAQNTFRRLPCPPFTLTPEQVAAVFEDNKSPDRKFAALIYRGASDQVAAALVADEFNPGLVDEWTAPPVQPAWAAAREEALAQIAKSVPLIEAQREAEGELEGDSDGITH